GALVPGYYMLRVNVTDKIGGYDILDHIFRIMDKGTPPPEDIPAFDMVSLDASSGLLFLMDEDDLPERSTWMELKGSAISQNIWDHGGQVLENAFIHETERGYLVTYDDNVTDRGDEYYITRGENRTLNVFNAELMSWQRPPSSSDMDIEYMVRIGSKPFLGDILKWTNIGTDPSLTRDMIEAPIGIYSVQVMATFDGNYSRVTQSILKVNDHNITYSLPESFKSYRGKGMGFTIEVTNFATYTDNLTIILMGTLANDDQVYLESSGRMSGIFSLESQKVFTIPESTWVTITIYPEEDYTNGEYSLILRMISEDGETEIVTENITITISDRPRDGFGEEISDDLYKFLTDTFPFLRSIKQSLLVPLFLLFVLLFIGFISTIGILIYRKKFRKERKVDPYKEQRKIYKELYGVDPTDEQLKEMKENKDGDDFFSDIPDIEGENKGPEKNNFDQGHLDSEMKDKSDKEGIPDPKVGSNDKQDKTLESIFPEKGDDEGKPIDPDRD
ncbi:MAG: hypothetical protein U9R75_07535, partial [Candidatus Thermoplasmatota archaeon]|nr:hypothetical protein [Candidatus Thermoplasmatota archaeon]